MVHRASCFTRSKCFGLLQSFLETNMLLFFACTKHASENLLFSIFNFHHNPMINFMKLSTVINNQFESTRDFNIQLANYTQSLKTPSSIHLAHLESGSMMFKSVVRDKFK